LQGGDGSLSLGRMEDVLALYEKPLSEEEPVVCIDEKPVVLHQDTRTPLPARQGTLARRDYEYKRCGTANVFCGVEPKAGRHFLKPASTRSAAEFADYLVGIVAAYPDAMTIHLVLDNLNTHGRKSLVARYGEKLGNLLWGRFTVHFTKRRIPDLATLRNEVRARSTRLNRNHTAIQWNFTRKQARRKLHYSFTKTW